MVRNEHTMGQGGARGPREGPRGHQRHFSIKYILNSITLGILRHTLVNIDSCTCVKADSGGFMQKNHGYG